MATSDTFTVAAVAYRVGQARSFEDFLVRIGRVVHRATEQGAELVVLPELAILDIVPVALDNPADILQLAEFGPDYVAYLEELSRALGITIVGGSHLESRTEGVVNTCAIVVDGKTQRVDKHILTQFEAVEWGLVPGSAPRSVDGVGVAICYDSEFPELVRPLARAEAWVLAVPFFTETRYGYQRVRWSGLARAIENQIFVVQAALVGSLGGEPVPSTYGRSAILTPSVPPFPESCVLAETPLNRSGIAVATLDFDALEASRNSGDVRNWNDYRSRF
ncbi:MAG: hypothetical protein IT363_12720 [Methanoregulaceae archaeon]|nr:hypothetical protein [Methanoregulaceae archaeon]